MLNYSYILEPRKPCSSLFCFSAVKFLYIYTKRKNDFSFSQAAYQGYVKLKQQGYTIDYIENADSLSNRQILNLIKQYHLKGYTTYILAGNEFSHVVTLAAQQYPDSFFATLAGNAQGTNVINYCFDCLSPGGYYAGKAALTFSKNDIIGFVGGLASVDGPSAEIFKQTVLANKPNAKVLISWTNNWSDITDAETLTEEQIKAGADVIVASANTGVITAASKYPNIKIIGWMVDISPLSSNVAASAVINTNVAYIAQAS